MDISALNGVSARCTIDLEHQRIMRELRALGIEPSGDKSTDKAKLQEARAAQKAEQASKINFVSQIADSPKASAESSQDNLKNDSAIQAQNMTGATQLAEMNKFRLLGF